MKPRSLTYSDQHVTRKIAVSFNTLLMLAEIGLRYKVSVQRMVIKCKAERDGSVYDRIQVTNELLDQLEVKL